MEQIKWMLVVGVRYFCLVVPMSKNGCLVIDVVNDFWHREEGWDVTSD